MLNISEFSGFAIQLSVFRTNRFKFGNLSSHAICKTHEAKSIAVTASLFSFPRVSAKFYIFAHCNSRPEIQTMIFQYLEFLF